MLAIKIIDQLTESFSSVVPKTDGRVKISHLQFVVYIVFHFFGDNKQSSLEGMRRMVMEKTAITISKGAFWERLAGDRFKAILLSLVETLMANSIGMALSTTQMLQSLKVTGILLFDSSTITLNDAAKKHFPGTGNKSGIKWHLCFNLFSGKQEWFELSESRKHDSNYFPPFELLKSKLIIFDLGYFDYQLLIDLIAAEVFFLCRLKSNSVVFIKEIVIGLTEKAIGKSLLSACNFNECQGNILEAIVQTTTKNNTTLACRAIGFWNENEKRYHWYLSNLFVSAKIIYPLYRLRWQIELLFKACKNSLNANTITSANPNIIQTLLLTSIAAHLSSQSIYEIAVDALSQETSQEKFLAITFQRIAFVFVTLKDKFINCILNPIQHNIETLVKSIHHMKNELYDPNYRKRETSKARLYRLLMNSDFECA